MSSLNQDTDNLDSIKRLLILGLVNAGLTTDEIGLALGVSGRRVRQIIPVRKVKKGR